MATITITPDFGYVVIAGAVIGLQVVFTGFRVMSARKEAFTKELMTGKETAQLREEHKKATGSDVLDPNGYPDMGMGRYAAVLPYDKWLQLANAQRAHGNFVEQAATVLTTTMLSGLFFPRATAALAAAYVVGRELYASGYTKKGRGGRVVGVLLLDVAMLVMFGLAVFGGARMTGILDKWIQ